MKRLPTISRSPDDKIITTISVRLEFKLNVGNYESIGISTGGEMPVFFGEEQGGRQLLWAQCLTFISEKAAELLEDYNPQKFGQVALSFFKKGEDES